MSEGIHKFFDASIRPPAGGWSLNIAGSLVTRFSESDIIAELGRWRRNNGTFVSEAECEREAWEYWCDREPSRCVNPRAARVPTPAARIVPGQPRELTKEVVGPWIWNFMNLVAAVWTPGQHDKFILLCDWVITLLQCPACREEWRKVLREDSPHQLASRYEVCQWINRVHNSVNERAGKPRYDYSRAVSEFGFPPTS